LWQEGILHKATGFTSNHIVELLEDAPGVERELREKRPLYRSSISIIEEMNTEVSEDDLETSPSFAFRNNRKKADSEASFLCFGLDMAFIDGGVS
jgi:hypothetical protein